MVRQVSAIRMYAVPRNKSVEPSTGSRSSQPTSNARMQVCCSVQWFSSSSHDRVAPTSSGLSRGPGFDPRFGRNHHYIISPVLHILAFPNGMELMLAAMTGCAQLQRMLDFHEVSLSDGRRLKR